MTVLTVDSDAVGFPILGGLLAFVALGEYIIYRQRKKKGWSYWRDVSKQWKAERMAELIKLREDGERAAGIKTEDKDLRYYHGLLKDGIISEEEFAKIKARFVG